MATEQGRLLMVWLRFLHSFALSDHLGDASESVRTMGELLALPVPPADADFEGWVSWVRDEYGVNEGVSIVVLRERGHKIEAPDAAPSLQQRLDAFLKSRGF